MGLCLTFRNELSKETHRLTKQETIGKVCPGGEQQSKGSQENCSAAQLSLSFMVMGLVSRLSLVGHFDSGSFLIAHTSLSQDGFK